MTASRIPTRFLASLAALALAACSDAPLRTAPHGSPNLHTGSHTHTTTDETVGTAAGGDVLLLSTTNTGLMPSVATELGLTVDIVTPAQWGAMTTEQFRAYKAIVLADPTCVVGTAPIAAAVANKATWGPAINGNIILIGTDEDFHDGQGGRELAKRGLDFAADADGKTGAYISLSCYYHGTATGTPVPLLDPFGSFTVTQVPGCFNDAHIVASHPAMTGLTDAVLSNWGCSVHEAFDKWPASFEVLAIAENVGAVFTAPDGTRGTPYILARGEGLSVISDITLTPASATNPVGTSHTLTATVTEGTPPAPIAGVTVTFTVESGPHAGTTGTGVTNASGVATFSYTGTALGTDIIRARFTRGGVTQTSSAVSKTWEAGTAGTLNVEAHPLSFYTQTISRRVTGGTYHEIYRWTDAPSKGPWKVTINWGDGTSTPVQVDTRQNRLLYKFKNFPRNGTYNIVVRVENRLGEVDTDDVVLRVVP